ncbi:transglutaminase domain-containing protein [Pontiella sp.]|uniref:transglutaminase domain-containing protein n=1 Tax=Pontiella sp. TaxID=2837462 RepID=UPI003564A9FE
MHGTIYALLLSLLFSMVARADSTADFMVAARQAHGALGERAAAFLVEHMPAADRAQLSADFLLENLELALKARETFPWAKAVPEEIFFNDVLPYAVLDETREAWRADYLETASAIVRDAKTATEAAQLLNRDFFDAINVHYSRKRKRPNQSPNESAELGKASCTGLSIILVDACRAVGIPARVAGTPLWTNKRGNHTWVEIRDGDWHFMGADEYNAEGVDRGWFVGAASKAQADSFAHAIYATSWKKTDLYFPMVWAQHDHSVPGLNVTDRYASPSEKNAHELGVRLFDEQGERIMAEGALISPEGSVLATFETRGNRADLNDVPRIKVEPGKTYRLRFGDRQTAPFVAEPGISTLDVKRAELEWINDRKDAKMQGKHDSKSSDLRVFAVNNTASQELVQKLFNELVEASRAERQAELEQQEIAFDGKTLRWLEKTYGEAPADGRSLWISMHGGGGAPTALNDKQWKNQINLYQPAEGIYIAPRAPTDTWNLWQQSHIDHLFARLIENHVALRGVNPNKVYLMGYSAGGDGVWQLAPRMADRFAAASMMAGHPGDMSLLGLYNLPFAIYMGGNDSAYKRNLHAAEKGQALDELQRQNPEGYIHRVRIYEGLGHWMQHNDREAVPWMAGFARNPWPKKIVWVQDNILHDRFYWLKIPENAAVKGAKIVAEVDGQILRLEGDVPNGTRVRLSEQLLDLDQPVRLSVNGTEVFNGPVNRDRAVMEASLRERLDPAAAAPAEIVVEF